MRSLLCGAGLRVALHARNSRFDLRLRFQLRVTQSHNLFCVFAFLVVRDLRLRFELRNSQPQFVFRFCDFLDVNLQDFVSKFLARYFTKFSSLNTFSPEKRHISASSEGRIGPNSRVGAPPLSSRLRGPPRNRKSSGGIFLRCCYTIPKASKQASKVLPNCPPIRSYISYLI